MNQQTTDAGSLMRVAFEAVDVQFGEYEYGVQVFSAVAQITEDGPLPHVVIMRSHSDPPAGIHLDCDYPLYGGAYDAVASVEVSPAGLRLDVRTDMAAQLRILGGYDIRWNLPGNRYREIVQGLRSLFRDTAVLTVAGT